MKNSRSGSSSDEFQPFAPLPSSRRTAAPSPPKRAPAPPPEHAPTPPARRNGRAGTPILGCLLLIVLLACAIGTAILGDELYFKDRVLPGVSLMGVPIGGLTQTEAQQVIHTRLGNQDQILARFGGRPFVLNDGEKVFRAWPWDLGFRTDLLPAVDEAFSIGHRGDIVLDLLDQFQALSVGMDVSAGADFDATAARAYLKSLAPQVERPARDAQVRLDALQVLEIPAQKGRSLVVDETLKRIEAHVTDSSSGEIAIAIQEIQPKITDTTALRKQIEAFIRAPLLFTFGDREWAVDQASLAALISIKPLANKDGSFTLSASLNHDAVVAKVSQMAREIKQAPRDARLHFDNGVVTPIIQSQEGRSLDVNATVQQVEQKFSSAGTAELRIAGNASPGSVTPFDALKDNSIPLNVQITKPAVDVRDLSKMGIKELVSQGVSNFRHSIPGRIQNIKTATSSFDGIVVPPGAIFSFDKYLIDVVEANGYEDAYVIFGNKTVLGPGGGVCQVSTTAFRAAFWGGFPIVERWAHAYRVGYYEPPIGLDATVFAPDVDFKFKNDTNSYLLIETSFDEKNTTLIFNFYGTKPNREVKMIGPDVSNLKPHGPDIYQDDPTLPKGTTKQVDFSVDGEDVTVVRQIFVNGVLAKTDRFFSRYAPWQAVFLRGTKE